MNDQPHNTPCVDLERFRKTARTKRELAWELLKETRNPTYVALRYGYDVKTMEAALAKIPDEGPPLRERLDANKRSHSARRAHTGVKRASEVLPESLRNESTPPQREPGCDDEEDWNQGG